MNLKNIIFVIVALVVGLAIGFVIGNQGPSDSSCVPESEDETITDPFNIAYVIEGDSVALTDGYSEKEIMPDSATKIKTSVWSNEPAKGDLNGDGVNDAALILTYDPGGSATFYYVVAAIKSMENEHYAGTNGVLLGDRIVPQNISIDQGAIIVNYTDRAQDEPMSTLPSIGKSKHLIVDGLTLKQAGVSLEEACLASEGQVAESLCCSSTNDFPNLCLVGPCGCSPDNSHEVKICDCGEGKCFDGSKCIEF